MAPGLTVCDPKMYFKNDTTLASQALVVNADGDFLFLIRIKIITDIIFLQWKM